MPTTQEISVQVRFPFPFIFNLQMDKYEFTDEEWNTCLKVLHILKDNPFENPDNEQIKTLISAIHKQAKKEIKKESYSYKKEQDTIQLKSTTIIKNTEQKISFSSHNPEETDKQYTTLNIPRTCYCCSKNYTQLHFFYHKLCPDCAEFHYNYRNQEHHFENYTVILTGGRVKIGYATALLFLRAGAKLILTTRFPALALEQLSKETDFDIWKNRLTVYGLDLRNLKAVNLFIEFCHQTLDSVDILINNAAQTIKYPINYYQTLITKEQNLLSTNTSDSLFPNTTPISIEQQKLLEPVLTSDIEINRFGQPIDERDKNSWNSTLDEIQLEELLEVNLINHISPYQLIAGLKPLMIKSEHSERFIINVTSSEGQFSYPNKTIFHPHTNMTKAALNMLTRTAAKDFISDNIFMNAVDVGWISTGAPEIKRKKLFDNLQIPPLDAVDGALRILHPIEEILQKRENWYGVLLKNYAIVNW